MATESEYIAKKLFMLVGVKETDQMPDLQGIIQQLDGENQAKLKNFLYGQATQHKIKEVAQLLRNYFLASQEIKEVADQMSNQILGKATEQEKMLAYFTLLDALTDDTN